MQNPNPFHVFVVPDGNRRWGEKHGLPKWASHVVGYKRFKEIAENIWGLGVTHLTFWALSRDNQNKRTPQEITELLNLLYTGTQEIRNSRYFLEKTVRIRFIGEWASKLPTDISHEMEALESGSKNYGPNTLTLLVIYDGEWEIETTTGRIKRETHPLADTPIDITRSLAPTRGLPLVDLYIRTDPEPHLSGLALPYLMRDPYLYLFKGYFPEFSLEELKNAIQLAKTRAPRLGG